MCSLDTPTPSNYHTGFYSCFLFLQFNIWIYFPPKWKKNNIQTAVWLVWILKWPIWLCFQEVRISSSNTCLRKHASAPCCQWLMQNATVRLSKWSDPCPLKLTPGAAGDLPYCVCCSITGGGGGGGGGKGGSSCYTLAHVVTGGWVVLSWFRVSFLWWRPALPAPFKGPDVRGWIRNGLYVASQKNKIHQTASVTHIWQSVIAGAPHCVPALKVVQVSPCLKSTPGWLMRKHTQLTACSVSSCGWSEAEHTI